MMVACVLLIVLTIMISFASRPKVRNVTVALWFLALCALVLVVSPSHFESIILILGFFLPFLTHFLAQGAGGERQSSLSLKPSGTTQVVSILITVLLGSIIILQMYKNRALIDSLWIPAQLKNRTVYQFMSEYYDVGLLISAIIVIFTALLSKRITEGHRS